MFFFVCLVNREFVSCLVVPGVRFVVYRRDNRNGIIATIYSVHVILLSVCCYCIHVIIFDCLLPFHLIDSRPAALLPFHELHALLTKPPTSNHFFHSKLFSSSITRSSFGLLSKTSTYNLFLVFLSFASFISSRHSISHISNQDDNAEQQCLLAAMPCPLPALLVVRSPLLAEGCLQSKPLIPTSLADHLCRLVAVPISASPPIVLMLA